MPAISRADILSRRVAIDSARAQAGLDPYPWTDSLPSTPASPVRAVHFAELRAATQDLWNRKRLGQIPQWTAGVQPNPGRSAVPTDTSDPDIWKQSYQDSQSPLTSQGLVSISYRPDEQRHITDAWCDNARALFSTSSPTLYLPIRTDVIESPNGSVDFSSYRNALKTWRDKGFSVQIVIPSEFYSVPGPWNINTAANGTLTGNGLTNAYIEEFSNRAVTLVNQLYDIGISTYWIWNEPNVKGLLNTGDNPVANDPPRIQALSPENFAALVYTTSSKMKNAKPVTIYAGSLSMLDGLTPAGQAGDFYSRVYTYLVNHQVNVYAQIPWNAISLNMELNVSSSYMDNVKDSLDPIQAQYVQSKDYVLSEWGIQDNSLGNNPPFDPPQYIRDLYDNFKQRFSLMYFMCHHHPGDETYGATEIDYGTAGEYNPGGDRVWYNWLNVLYMDQI
jgi:hypothetical protein